MYFIFEMDIGDRIVCESVLCQMMSRSVKWQPSLSTVYMIEQGLGKAERKEPQNQSGFFREELGLFLVPSLFWEFFKQGHQNTGLVMFSILYQT